MALAMYTNTSSSSCCSRCSSSRQQLRVHAQAPLSGAVGGAASSNSTGAAAGGQLAGSISIDRPSGGGTRSFELPRSSDLSGVWAPRSDLLRPSGGASRGAVFATSSNAAAGSSLDRPGGRGGRSDLTGSIDVPDPIDPASGRPGGRGGRDMDLTSSGSGVPSGPISLDRPGGRGGRGDIGGSGGGGSGGGGGGSSGGGAAGGGGGAGKAVGSIALYGGVIAAAWFGHQAFFADKQPEPAKPCCSGKKGAKKK